MEDKSIIDRIEKVKKSWKEEMADISEYCIINGDKADTIKYNISSAQALTLSKCINDISELLTDFYKEQ